MKNSADLIPTRHSLLSRLKDWNDHASWQEFFDTYWRLIYYAAIKAGLSDAEAQDAVQETVISVMKGMQDFQYDPKKGSFKGWLLRLTKWRVADQFRKRQFSAENKDRDDFAATDLATIENIPCPESFALDALWEQEWEQNLVNAAVDRVKEQVDPQHYQIFDLYVMKKWDASKVAKALHVSISRVYMVKHRVSHLLRKELTYLRTKSAL